MGASLLALAKSIYYFTKEWLNTWIKVSFEKKQYENKGRQLVIRSSTCISSILSFSCMWLALQFSFHRLFRRIFLNYFGWQLIIANVPLLVHVHRRYGNLCPNLWRQEQADHKSRLPDYWRYVVWIIKC